MKETCRNACGLLVCRLLVCGLLVCGLLVFSAPSSFAASGPEDVVERVRSLVEKANRQFWKGDYQRAAKLYSKADEVAGGRAVAALSGLTRSWIELGDYDRATAAGARWQDLASTPESRAEALLFAGLIHYRRGIEALAHSIGGGDDQGRVPASERKPMLRRAVEAFRASLASSPVAETRAPAALWLADSLVDLGEWTAAGEALEVYVAAGGEAPHADDLRCLIDLLGDEAPAEGETTGAVLIGQAPLPKLPLAAAVAGVRGAVILAVAIDRRGEVACVRVIRGLPHGVTEAMVEAVRQRRYEPARRQGEAVPSQQVISEVLLTLETLSVAPLGAAL